MTQLRIQLLGSPSIERDGKSIASDRRKAVALLAYLALESGNHTREQLAALLWPDYDAQSAGAYLRRTLWEMRQLVGDDAVSADRSQIGWQDSPTIWLDVSDFRRNASQADEASLTRAAELYRGDFMAGFSLQDAPDFDDWQRFQTEALRSRLGSVFERLALLREKRGDLEQSLSDAVRWIALDPLHEPAHRLLMRLLVASGNRAAALRQYDDLIRMLRAELRAEPDAETQQLAADIRSGNLAQSPEPSAEVPRVDAPLACLPADVTLFLGRQTELTEVRALLATPSCRLLTLVGPGGVGKTRLAVQAARNLSDDFPDGVYFVPLAALAASDQIVMAVAKAMDFTFYGEGDDPRQQLLGQLRRRRMLLIMDNYEHLLAGAEFVADALTTAPGVKILATSRTRLNLRSEHLYNVTGLTFPKRQLTLAQATSSSAVQLFAASARRVWPDFALTVENIEPVVQICAAVEGLPLAIELAAGWVGLFSPVEIAAELRRNFDLLSTDLADVPDRQRSMRSVFDTTWAMLTLSEQKIMACASLFRGSFTREALQHVAQASLQDIAGLLNKSLLRRTDQGRFDLHELVRQYAAERLAADGELTANARARFSGYYLRFLAEQTLLMYGPEQKAALDAVGAEREQVRAAWLWSIADGRLPQAIAAVEGLVQYYSSRAIRSELAALAAAALDVLPDAAHADVPLLRAMLLTFRAWALTWVWSADEPTEWANEALQIVSNHNLHEEMGALLAMLGMALDLRDAGEKGPDLLKRSVEIERARGNLPNLAQALEMQSSSYLWRGQLQEAETTLNECISICRQTGDRLQLAHSLLALAQFETQAQNYEAAKAPLTESQRIFDSLGDRAAVAEVLYQAGITNQRAGNYREAVAFFDAGCEVIYEMGDTDRSADMLSWGSIAAREGGLYDLAWERRERAEERYRQADDEHGLAWCQWERGELLRQQERFAAARPYFEMSRQQFEALDIIRGKTFYHASMGKMSLDEGDHATATRHFQSSLEFAEQEGYAWGRSLAANRLGQAALAAGEYRSAAAYFRTGLKETFIWPDEALANMALIGLAQTAMQEGKPDQAATLVCFVHSRRTLFPETAQLAQKLRQDLRERFDPDVFDEIERAAIAHTLSGIAQAVLAELD
ncbi:MAG: AAA family ATPase [Caldilineales bacterium]|nr:AAA family ATPase [Caldilineales bacterium]